MSGRDLACPDCRQRLRHEGEAYHCDSCGRTFPVRDGIPSFVQYEGFYDDRFNCTHFERPTGRSGLRNWLYLNLGWDYYTVRRRFFLKHMPQRGRILDIGCAAGSEWLNQMGHVTGVDLSLDVLRRAGSVYPRVIQAEIGRLPFADSSFEYVLTGDVMGHLEPDVKEALLDDVERLLVPGGKTLHSIETYGWLRRKAEALAPDLYQKHFVDAYGHIGLETVPDTLHRFSSRGWSIETVRHSVHVTFSINELLEGFDNEYTERSKLIRQLVRIGRIAYPRAPMRLATNQILRGIDGLAGLILGRSSANVLFIAARP